MKNLIIILSALSITGTSFGFTLPKVYLSGKQVCEKYKHVTSKEFSIDVEVPVDYSNPDGEKTIIYSYTKKEFNPNLPSVIYFTGGPGSSSRGSEFSLPNTNVIFFEQRGVSCSRPATRELFLDPAFYTSENTARDALAIVQKYKINSITVFGQSYGTITATIFASLFPEYTNALVVEGVIYEGNKSLWSSEIKRRLLQQMFDSLSEERQERVLKLSRGGKLPANWFAKIGGMLLYINEGVDIFNPFIDKILSMDDEGVENFISIFYPDEKDEEEFSFGDVMMGMIGCQEISMNDLSLSLNLVFNDRQLEYDKINKDFKERCVPLKLTQASGNFYQAIKYPVSVSTFYLLGENDGATDLNQGLLHYENIPSDKKTLMIMPKGGHLPSLSLLKDNYPCDPNKAADHCDSLKQNVLMGTIFEKIVHEQMVSEKDLKQFNLSGSLKWTLHDQAWK